MTSSLSHIIDGLTEARKAVILSLPADGSFGPACDSRCARRMFRGVGCNQAIVIQHEHCTDNSWRLSDIGLEVRSALQASSKASDGEGGE